MSTREQNTKLGLLLVVAGVILAVLLVASSGVTLFDEDKHFHIRIHDSVSGLGVGSAVELLGVQVGQVEDVRLEPSSASVVVTVSVASEVHVPVGSSAVVKRRGFTDLRYIDIAPGSGDQAVPPDSELAHKPSSIARLLDNADALARRTDSIMAAIDKLLVTATATIEGADMSRFQLVLDRAAETLSEFQAAAASTRRLMNTSSALVAESRRPLRDTLADVSGAARHARDGLASADELIVRADAVVGNMDALVTELHRTAGASDASIAQTLANLRQASRDLERFADKLRRDPSSALFADPPAPRKLP